MSRILIASLALHWTVVFGVQAVGAGEAASLTSDPALPAVAAVAYSLAAAVFLWTALAAWSPEPAGGSGEVARLALVIAVPAIVAGAGAAAISGGRPQMGVLAMQLAALAATYLVIRFEEEQASMQPSSEDRSGALARRLAVGAAHGSMLSRLAARGPQGVDG